MISPTPMMEMAGAGEQSWVGDKIRQGTVTDVVVASVDGDLISFVGGRMGDWHSSITSKMGTVHSLAPKMETRRRDRREIVKETNNDKEERRQHRRWGLGEETRERSKGRKCGEGGGSGILSWVGVLLPAIPLCND